MTTNKPAFQIDDGLISLTVWENPTENSSIFSAELTRSYQEDDQWKKTHSLSGADLLIAARLYERAYDQIARIRAKRREEAREAKQAA